MSGDNGTNDFFPTDKELRWEAGRMTSEIQRSLENSANDTEQRLLNFTNSLRFDEERLADMFFTSKVTLAILMIVLFVFIWNKSGSLRWRLLFTLIVFGMLSCIVMVIESNTEKLIDILREKAAEIVSSLRTACDAKRSASSTLIGNLIQANARCDGRVTGSGSVSTGRFSV